MSLPDDRDVSALSDDELGHELRDRFGYKAGPITSTTRSVYEKKLVNLRKNPPPAKLTPSKRTQNGDSVEPSPLRRGRKSLPLPSPSKSPSRADAFAPSLSPISDAATATPTSASSRRVSRRATMATSPPKPNRSINRPNILSTYSSDEEELAEDVAANEAIATGRLENGSVGPPVIQTVSSAAKPRNKGRMSTPSFPLAPRIALNRSPGRSGRMSAAQFGPVVPPLSGFSDSEPEVEEEHITRPANISLRSRKRAALRIPVDDIATRAPESNKTVASSSFLSSSSYNWVSCSILAVSIAFFLSVFFYYFINSAYFSELKASSIAPAPPTEAPLDSFPDLIAKLKAPLCAELLSGKGKGPCINDRNDIQPALVVIKNIRTLFEDKLLHHFCSSTDGTENDISDDPEVLSLAEIRAQLAPALMPSLEKLYQPSANGDQDAARVTLFHRALQDAITLIQLNPELRMHTVTVNNEVTAVRVHAAHFTGSLPIGCRVRLGLVNAFWTVTVVVCIIVITIIIYHLFASQKERKHQQQRLFLELLEKSLELLQSPDEPGSMPVLHIRDTLISPTERKDAQLMKVWAQVVRHIESEESRVKVDMEEIEGETFKTWKWLCSPLNMDSASNLMTGSIEWQGQAFNERDGLTSAGQHRHRSSLAAATETREVDFEAPTAFLKVRNMFDEETVATANSKNDSYWKTKIKNAIVEKCAMQAPEGRHGVCHIFVDERNAKEGLVYVKCVDQKAATAAYRSLHGWWCEKRLVSVRFLKDERYFSRFPESRSARAELRLEPVVDED